MLPTFPYMAMTITGILHVITGGIILISASVGMGMDADTTVWYYNQNEDHVSYSLHEAVEVFLGLVLGSSFWIIMVGILGIVTGIKSADHKRTQCLKIAYMVTAILSAIIFSLVGLSLSSVVSLKSGKFNTIGVVGSIASFANFVLAIVSSSICCCCSNSPQNTTGVVFVQAPPGNYPPGTYPPGTYPPGNYPPGTYPTGNYPPGTYPPPSYPSSVQTYSVAQSPPEGVSNPGYQVNPNPVNYPTKNEVV